MKNWNKENRSKSIDDYKDINSTQIFTEDCTITIYQSLSEFVTKNVSISVVPEGFLPLGKDLISMNVFGKYIFRVPCMPLKEYKNNPEKFYKGNHGLVREVIKLTHKKETIKLSGQRFAVTYDLKKNKLLNGWGKKSEKDSILHALEWYFFMKENPDDWKVYLEVIDTDSKFNFSEFGENLKMAREQDEITQEELAKLFKLELQDVIDYESGCKTPSLKLFVDFVCYFNMSADYFLGLKD